MSRNVMLPNSKVMSHLRNYLSKLVTDKSVESALNQEINQLLQKLQVSGIYFWRNIEKTEVKNDKEETKQTNNIVPQSEVKETKKIVPKWKETQVLVSKESITAHTNHIINLISCATTTQSILKRVEELNSHLHKYSDARHIAQKANATRVLLKLQHKACDELKGAINEALALLGHTGAVRGKGIRILSIDGGGVRGILVLEMLKKLEELTGKRTYEMFDLICGVSTGAIIASLLGAKLNSLDEISDIYKNLSTQIFTQSALKGTSSLVWSHSYYDTALWEKLLKEQNGDRTLISTRRNPQCPKLCILSAVLNQTSLSAYIFRNYTMPSHVQSRYDGGHKYQIWEAVRASAAAPTYFEEFKLGNKLHQDGGILYNNPTAVALHEARLLWPQTPIQCVLSFGTGRTISHPIDAENVAAVSYSSWKSKLHAVIGSATDTEGTHTMLSDLLPDKIYYRFNPYLTEMLDMAEIESQKLEQLKRDAVMYLRRNEDKFQEAAKVLSCGKSWNDKVVDWMGEQQEILGVKF